jgi:dTDP-4-amino-4,6-dideoxygalactose transaminase
MLHERGIQTGIHYPVPIHKQPSYAELADDKQSYPHSEAAANSVLSLPMYAELSHQQIAEVGDAVLEGVKRYVQ